jgi:hypothetical protein
MANPKRNSRILWTIVLALSLVFAISYAGRLASRAYLLATLERQAAALEAARQLKKINMNAHKHTKLKVRKALLELLDNAIIQDQEHLG